jgi:DNA polymerase-3 subunit beta
MHFTIERNTLLQALGHVTGIVERRNTIPILANVLLSAGGGGLTLKATDLDVEAVENLPAQVERQGALTVLAHTLHDIVRKIPESEQIEVSRDQDAGQMNLVAGRARFSLAVLPADDFPDAGQAQLSHSFFLLQGDLKRLFDKARFAISTEETRYYLNGIYLHAFGEPGARKLRAVATDGHRLAKLEMDCPSGAESMPGIIVPRKVVSELIKLLTEPSAPVEISVSQTKIRFTVGSVVLTSKLIDGTFPDYARVIPTGNNNVLHVGNADFMKAVDRVSTLSAEKGKAVKLNLATAKMVLSVTNPDSGSATEELIADYAGPALEIGFNSRYLMDIAGQIEGLRAEFRLADASSPTLISDEADSSALYVLMPMRV